MNNLCPVPEPGDYSHWCSSVKNGLFRDLKILKPRENSETMVLGAGMFPSDGASGTLEVSYHG